MQVNSVGPVACDGKDCKEDAVLAYGTNNWCAWCLGCALQDARRSNDALFNLARAMEQRALEAEDRVAQLEDALDASRFLAAGWHRLASAGDSSEMTGEQMSELVSKIVPRIVEEVGQTVTAVIDERRAQGSVRLHQAKRERRLDRRSDDNSWVYFIQSGELGPIKIGKTVSVDTRLRELQTGSGEILRLLHAIPPGGPTEREMHERFAAHRRHREWFDPDPEILAFIEEASGQ